MVQKTIIHGFSVSYEDNASEGISHLRNDLDYNEAKVFFDQARARGSAQFENDEEHQFTLLYQSGAYALLRR